MSTTTVDGQNGPAPASTASSPSSAQPAQQTQQSIPFIRASRKSSQQDFATNGSVALGGQQLGPFDIQTNGFLRYLEVVCSAAATGNTATVVFAQDGPMNALQGIQFRDPSSEQIITPYSGAELGFSNKYHGYMQPPESDPKSDPNYSATAGSGATAGSFTFVLRVPLEDRTRDAFGAVPNSAGNKNYRLQATTGTSANVYSTAPTTVPGITLKATNFFWTEPPGSIAGVPTVSTPNGNGTVCYLDRETFSGIAGLNNPTLQNKNVGRVYKSIINILYNSTPARDSSDWPDPWAFWINGFPMYYKPKDIWTREIQLNYGFNGTIDTAGGPDTGVFPFADMMNQSGHVDQWGPADQYLATVASTKLSNVGNWGASANELVLLERTIKPISGAALYA